MAALPVRRTSGGAIEVLLVTSRESRRWIVPKGWPWPGLSDAQSAAGEAKEEAGVTGRVDTQPFGTFIYRKQREGASMDIGVDVYLLWVEVELESWLESHQRERRWASPAEAAAMVEFPQLKALLLAIGDLSRSGV
ncbi:MAG: NUDIX hydrolase [Hyphomicrobium sp.]